MKIRTILHPTDFSKYSEGAWYMACALARDYGAKLIVLHAQEFPAAVYGEFGTLPAVPFDAETIKQELARIEPTFKGLTVERRMAQGDPAAEIVRVAKEHHCDLIVLGTHGRTGLGRLLMGSVAEQVVRKAHCPVMTLKTPIGETAAVMKAEAVPVAPSCP